MQENMLYCRQKAAVARCALSVSRGFIGQIGEEQCRDPVDSQRDRGVTGRLLRLWKGGRVWEKRTVDGRFAVFFSMMAAFLRRGSARLHTFCFCMEPDFRIPVCFRVFRICIALAAVLHVH